MKRAEDWLDDWDNETKWTRLSLIEAIQRDALLHAARLCRERYPNTFAAKSRAFASEACAQSIEFEADKLKP